MKPPTRRELLTRTVLGFGGYLAVGTACPRTEGDAPKVDKPAGAKAKADKKAPAPPGPGLRTLTAAQHQTCAAACERILPRDQDPGATDLGCADYIDRALADPELRVQFGRAFIGGLDVLERHARRQHKQGFHELLPADQDALLSKWQKSSFSGESAFFELLHTFTLEGALGDPIHGGNRGGLGFLLVGFVPPEPLPGGGHVHLKIPKK